MHRRKKLFMMFRDVMPYTLGKLSDTSEISSFRDSVTAKLKCILLNNFYVCGPTSMKFIVHLVFKVSKVVSHNSGQGPIILGDVP